MTDQELENFITQHLTGLPRRNFLWPDKEVLWMRVHNHILQSKLETGKEEKASILDVFSGSRMIAKVAVTTLVVILALTIVGGVANAQPGETLYPVKKAAEQVEKALASSNEAKVKVGVKQARRRLAEVKLLVQENKDAEIVAQTLADLKITTQEVVAVTESQPELAAAASQLAEIKEAVDEIIAAAEPKKNVEGAVIVEEENAGGVNSTSTKTVVKTPRKIKTTPIPQDAPVQADLNIGDVVKIENNEPEPIAD